MKIITYATDYNHSNIKLLTKKLQIELVPNCVSWDSHFYAKAYCIYQFIKQYDEDELILSIDGYDVLPLNGCNLELLEEQIIKYFDINKVTFNAETNCYPDHSLAKLYPVSNSKWKYLNAGMFVGKNKNVQRMYESVLDNIKKSMDQLQFSLLYINSDLINLDHQCCVFQTLYDGKIGGNFNTEDFILDVTKKEIINKHFNSKPLLFHGNGKVNMSKLSPYL